MPTEKSEKVKLSIVLGLLIVAAVVAYIRFMPDKKTPEGKPTSAPPLEMKYSVSQTKKSRPERPRRVVSRINGALSTNIRDIFAPLEMPAEPKPLAPAKTAPEPPLVLKLKGTIIGGTASTAIINDTFARIGEKIGQWEVVKIDPNEVLLKCGGKEKVLHVLVPVNEQ